MDGIIIAQAVPTDAVGIQNLLKESSHDMYIGAGYTEEDFGHRFKDSLSKESIEKLERFLIEPKNELYLVAKDENVICGLCYIEKIPDKNILHAMYVLPKYQGRGVAHALWGKGINFIDRSKPIYLDVIASNQKAISFYKSVGFEETGKRTVDENFVSQSGVKLEEIEMVLK